VKELEYAGAVALLMGRSKMLDSYYDSGSTVSDVMIRMLNRKSLEAERVLKRLDFPSTIFDEQMRRQHALELMEGDATLEELCEPTGRVVSKVFEHTASLSGMNENREALSLIGSDLGSLMYVLDSYTDISDDVSENKFNPFIACRSIQPVLNRGNLNRILKISWDFSRQRLLRMKENCERLNVRRYGSLVLRTLTTDLETRIQGILSAVNSRKRETNLLKNQLLPAIALVGFKLKTQNGDCEDCFLCWDVGDCTMALTSMVVENVLTATATGGGAAVIGGGAASVISNLLNRPSEPSAPEETPEEQLGEPEEEDLEELEPSETEPPPERAPEIPDQTVPEVPPKDTSTINPPEQVPPRNQIASSDPNFLQRLWNDTPFVRDLFDDWKRRWAPEAEDEARKRDDQAREGVQRMTDALDKGGREGGGVYSRVSEVMSDPERYSTTGEGDPRTVLENELRARYAGGGTEALKVYRDLERLKSLTRSGGPETGRVRDGSGPADAARRTVLRKTVPDPYYPDRGGDPTWWTETTRTGFQTGNRAASAAINEFQRTYNKTLTFDETGRIPDEDFQKLKTIYDDLKRTGNY